MKGPSTVFLLVVALLGAFAIMCVAAPVGAWWLHHGERYDEEIAWVESFQPLMPMRSALDGTLDRLHRERIERELRAGRLDHAVQAVRAARAWARRSGRPLDPAVTDLGLETYTRAADRLARQGRLSLAADWNDTLFAFAVRDPDEHRRSAAVAAFAEGLDLRVRDGQPCAALARVQWAQHGLGGEVPEFGPEVEQRLQQLCDKSRRGGVTR